MREGVITARVQVKQMYINVAGGAVASWLVRSTPDRVVRVRVLTGDIVLCSWARESYSHGASLHAGEKWVPVKMLGITLRWTSIPSRGE